MSGCTPPLAAIRAVSAHVMAPHRPVRRVAHYALSKRAHGVAAQHHASGHPVAHARVVRHPRPAPVHAVHPAPVDTGACGVSSATPRLAMGAALAGTAAVGAGTVGVLARTQRPAASSDGGYGLPGGFAGTGFGALRAAAPGGSGPGGSGPGGGGPGGSDPGVSTPSGGGGLPVVVVNSQPSGPVSVPEPSTLMVLGLAVLALSLVRLRRGRG